MDLSIRVIAFNTFVQLALLASRHPHLSVVQVVKDHFRRAVVFTSSAAERRDYEELLTNRQAFLQIFFAALYFHLTLQPPRKAPAPLKRCALYRFARGRQCLFENF